MFIVFYVVSFSITYGKLSARLVFYFFSVSLPKRLRHRKIRRLRDFRKINGFYDEMDYFL